MNYKNPSEVSDVNGGVSYTSRPLEEDLQIMYQSLLKNCDYECDNGNEDNLFVSARQST